MSLSRPPKMVKLLMSFLYRKEETLAEVLKPVDERFGPMDFLSESLPFDFTSYYEAEMGKDLKRRLASFRPLISPEQLPEIKIWTNRLEDRNRNELQGRRINIDPGYLTGAKLVLATGKDFSHRIYLRDGIYGDLTLIFKKGSFVVLPWTFPDYASSPLLDLLTGLRKRYLWQIKNTGAEGPRNQEAGKDNYPHSA